MNLTTTVVTITGVLMVITAVMFFYQTAYLFVPLLVKPKPHKEAVLHRFAILIAARNEELVLPHLLDTITRQDYPKDLFSIFVVADNCTDNTAVVAEAHGAKVYRRFNKEKVGKGYAINYLLSQIEADGGLDRFDAFLMFDADNLLKSDYITQINRVYSDGFSAFCGYRNSKNFSDNWVSSGHALWYLHESTHLNHSRMLLGVTCAVSGTGFGFTRQLLEQCGGWQYFTLTEDLEFTAWCATRGITIGYCHDAILYDEQPSAFRQSWRQRTRWAQGGFQVSIRYLLDYIRGIRKGGRTAYSSFETASLSFWGTVWLGISGVMMMLSTFLLFSWKGIAVMTLFSLIFGYFFSVLLGGWTLATEWDRIRATKAKKILSAFTFPFFVMTIPPIAITALFRKFSWPPIEHPVAISAEELEGVKTK